MSASDNLSTMCSGLLLRSSFPILDPRYTLSAWLEWRPSRSHLGYQIHQTYCLPTSSEPPPPRSVACCGHQVQSFDLSQTFWCHGFDEQIFGADEQNPGRGQSDKEAFGSTRCSGAGRAELLGSSVIRS